MRLPRKVIALLTQVYLSDCLGSLGMLFQPVGLGIVESRI